MRLIGLARLGRDAELRFAANGDSVASFSGAFDYGRRGADGRRPTQWVDLSLWGKRAETLAPYLKKGQLVMFVGTDVHVEVYDKRDGSVGHKLVARVDDIEFAGRPDVGGDGATAPAAARSDAAPSRSSQSPAARAPARATAFDDMDDDIPF